MRFLYCFVKVIIADGSLAAIQSNAPDGSGGITANGTNISYAAGNSPNVTADDSGNVNASFSQPASQLQVTGADGSPYTVAGALALSADPLANLTFTGAMFNGIAPSLWIPSNGTGPTFTAGNGEKIALPTSSDDNPTTYGLGNDCTNGIVSALTTGTNGASNLSVLNASNGQPTAQASAQGDTVSTTFFDDAGNAILGFATRQGQILWNQVTFTKTADPDLDYQQFQTAVADALASQVISKSVPACREFSYASR